MDVRADAAVRAQPADVATLLGTSFVLAVGCEDLTTMSMRLRVATT